MSETPRTDELKRGIWRLMQSQEREEAYAWRDAIHCGIEQLERDLAAEKRAQELLAIRVLGQAAYDNSPCQAHPFELIEQAFAAERERAERLTERLQQLAAEVLRLKLLLPDDYARADMESREP